MSKPVKRASRMDRDLSCHGAPTLETIVAPRQGAEGFEGSYLHWLIAKRLITEQGAIPPEGGLPPPDVPPGYLPPANSLWIVDWACRHVAETIPADWSLMVEVHLTAEFGRWEASGHQDVLAISPDGTQMRGKDWKCGYIPVDVAEENDQVLTYLVEDKINWPSLTDAEFEICQPRLSEEDGFQRVSKVVLKGARLENAPATLDARVCEALDDPHTLTTGPKQCKWCIGCSCPAIQEEQKLMKMKLTPEILARIKAEPDDALLGDFWETGRMLAKPLEDATTMLKARVKANGYVDSGCGTRVTMDTQKGSYSFPNTAEYIKAARVILPDDDDIAAIVTPSVTRTKDRIAMKLNVPKTGKAAVTAESIFDGHLRVHCEQGVREILRSN